MNPSIDFQMARTRNDLQLKTIGGMCSFYPVCSLTDFFKNNRKPAIISLDSILINAIPQLNGIDENVDSKTKAFSWKFSFPPFDYYFLF